MWGNKASKSVGLFPFRQVLGPLLLIILPPILINVLTHAALNLDGDFYLLYQWFNKYGWYDGVMLMYPTEDSTFMVNYMIFYIFFQVVLMLFLPGKVIKGPTSPSGYTPTYKNNEILCLIFTVAAYIGGAYIRLWLAGDLYFHFREEVNFLSLMGIVMSIILYIKGKLAPSGHDNISSNVIFDFYWGIELYPKIFGYFDIKHFLVTRMGMFVWAIFLVDFCFAQMYLFGYVRSSLWLCVILQWAYIIKNLLHNYTYRDVSHDHAGFYVCFKYIAWVPGFYSLASAVIVKYPVQLGVIPLVLIAVVGFTSLYMQYQFEEERRRVRLQGKDDHAIKAVYKTTRNASKVNLLFINSTSRHFNYVLEIIIAFCWCCPGLNFQLPMLYVVYVVLVLLDQGYRSDAIGKSKYGGVWKEYVRKVKYRFIPNVF